MKKTVLILIVIAGLLLATPAAAQSPGPRCEPGRDPDCGLYHRIIRFPGHPPICTPGFFDYDPGPPWPWMPGGCDDYEQPTPPTPTDPPIVTTVAPTVTEPPIVTTPPVVTTVPPVVTTQPPPTARPTEPPGGQPTSTYYPTAVAPYPTPPPPPYPGPGSGNVFAALGDGVGVCTNLWDCICTNLERIAAALEKIALIMEQQ